MEGLDRNRVIELLRQLGVDDDATALAAARELHRSVSGAGVDWNDLLLAETAAAADAEEEEEIEAEEDSEPPVNVPAGKEGDLRIIERLLGRKNISDTLRSDLNDFKQAIREGTFDKMDSDYLRALAKRLGASN